MINFLLHLHSYECLINDNVFPFCFETIQIRNDFLTLLDEQKFDSKAQWRKVRSKIEKDPRFKAVENTSQREEWFKEHLEQLDKVT